MYDIRWLRREFNVCFEYVQSVFWSDFPASRAPAVLIPYRHALRVHDTLERAPGCALHSEQFAGRAPELLRHDVVEDRVDSGAQVKQHKGHQVAVFADLGDDRRIRLRWFGDEIPTHVKWQPAENKRQNHHSWWNEREKQY